MKKEINIQTGEQIKSAREPAKLTQEQFAEHIDVSPQYVSDLEHGVVGISIATLKRICTALGVSSDQILFGQETKNRAASIAEKSKPLSEKQFVILSEIISKYVEATSLRIQCNKNGIPFQPKGRPYSMDAHIFRREN